MNVIIICIALLFLDLSFSVNLIEQYNISKYTTIILGALICIQMFKGFRMYLYLNEKSYIRENMYRKESSGEKIKNLNDIIDSYNTTYIIAKEKFEFLKSLSLISLAAIIAPYVVDNDGALTNWNNYLTFICIGLALYFIQIYQTYQRIVFFKLKENEVRKDLRELELYLNTK